MKALKITILMVCIVLCISVRGNAQTRNWNFGISEGLGGVHYFFLPAVDIQYKRHSIRLSPTLPAQSLEYQVNVLRLISKEDESLDLVAATAFTHSNDVWQMQLLGERIWFVPVNRLSVLTGIRYDFARRMSLGLFLGASYQKIRTTGNFDVANRGEKQFKPAFEASIGVKLFPHATLNP